MRHLRIPRLVRKVLVMGLLLGGYVLADGNGQAAGACPIIYPSCAQCQDVYDYELWACRNGCSYGDYDCWYTMCEAHAAGARTTCENCCINP